MIARCIADETPFGVVLLTQGSEVRSPEQRERFAETGTLANVIDTTGSTANLLQILCQGGARFELISALQGANGLWTGEAEIVADDHSVHIPAELRGASDALERVLASLTDVPKHRWPVQPPFQLDDCGWVANRWCELLPLPDAQKHQMLMLDNPLIRLELLHDVLDEHGMLTS